MRIATLALLMFLPPVLGACAPQGSGGEIGPNPQEFGVIAPEAAEEIPLYTSRGLPGCRYQFAGELTSATLLGLRDEAHQKLADAVVNVRRQIVATPPPRRQSTEVRPAAVMFYTGTAVRFRSPECRPQ